MQKLSENEGIYQVPIKLCYQISTSYKYFRTMSDCMSKSDQNSTIAWLGGWPLTNRNTENNQKPDQLIKVPGRQRRSSCKGVESAMAGSLGKVWYDS